LPNIIGPGTRTRGYVEYFNKAIEESAKGQPYTVYVAPQVRLPVMHVQDAARAFLELAQTPVAQLKTVNYIVLGPTPSPTAQELVDTIQAKMPWSKLDFKVNEKISKLIETVTALPFEDKYARQEWGWQHRYSVEDMVDQFLAGRESHS
jgi:threonine 3-dehydrogenase